MNDVKFRDGGSQPLDLFGLKATAQAASPGPYRDTSGSRAEILIANKWTRLPTKADARYLAEIPPEVALVLIERAETLEKVREAWHRFTCLPPGETEGRVLCDLARLLDEPVEDLVAKAIQSRWGPNTKRTCDHVGALGPKDDGTGCSYCAEGTPPFFALVPTPSANPQPESGP